MEKTSRTDKFIKDQTNIRNVGLIGYVDHGRSTLYDYLVSSTGFLDAESIKVRHPSTSALLHDEKYLINLSKFNHELTASYLMHDGVVLVIDAVEFTHNMSSPLLKPHNAGIKSILLINKVDRLIRELQLSRQEIFLLFQRIIDHVNNEVGTSFDPTSNNVIFASGIGGWGFTLADFAKIYAKKFSVSQEKLLPKLWGQNYFNNTTKHWQTYTNSPSIITGFEQFVIDPIIKIFTCCHDNNHLEKIFETIGIVLTESEKKLNEKMLSRLVLNRWMPLDRVFCEACVNVFPSPVEGQKVIVKELYSGHIRDETYDAIEKCDSNGHLCVIVAEVKNFPGSSLAFGRVFSGTLHKGQTLMAYPLSGKLIDNAQLTNIGIVTANGYVQHESVPSGNFVVIEGLDKIKGPATLVTSVSSCPLLRPMMSEPDPLVFQVTTKNEKDKHQLNAAVDWVNKTDALVHPSINENGDLDLVCVSDLHFEVTFEDLKQYMKDVELVYLGHAIKFKETIRQISPSVSVKSVNKKSNIVISLEPIIDHNLLEQLAYLHPNAQYLAKEMVAMHRWSPEDANNILYIDNQNILVNKVKDLPDDLLSSLSAGFCGACAKGPLAEFPLYGIKVIIESLEYPDDIRHRNSGQIVPLVRTAIRQAFLLSMPTLMAPYNKVEITCVAEISGAVYGVISKRNGSVVSEDTSRGNGLVIIVAMVPVVGSFGFTSDLRANTGGRAFPNSRYDHMEPMSGDVYDITSELNSTIVQTRIKLGLPPTIPVASDFA